MTPERASAWVARWVRRYTRGLPEPVARRRIEEMASDVHDHVADGRARGTGERRIALAVLSRAIRGACADTAWRAGQRAAAARPARREKTMRPPTPIRRSVTRVALATGLVLLVPLIATLATDGPGWSPGDFVLAAVLLAGVGATLELAVRRSAGTPLRTALGIAGGVAGVGGLAMVLGEADDAPGLVVAGILLVAAALTLAVRTLGRRSGWRRRG
jgi:hypothetical protein